jgi:VWFA-related protein
MPRLLLPLLVLAALPSQSYAQSTNPESSVVTLHKGTRLVVVDVVVTDSHKNPVRNLKASDFTLLENNVTQKIQHFDEHTRVAAAGGAKEEPARVMPPGIFTNYSSAPAGDSVNVLLLDTLNTPATDQSYVKDQIRKFLKEAKPGVPIAIFGLTTRLSLLQSFTADPELLKNAIDKKNSAFSALLASPVTGGPAQKMSDDYPGSNGGISGTQPGGPTADKPVSPNLPNLQAFQADEALAAENVSLLRARYTLDALNQLGRYLAGMPGRKNLIWFSGSFPVDITPTDAADQFHGSYEALEDEFRETTNLLTRAQVAVYPVDARGVVISMVGDVSQSGSKYVNDWSTGADPAAFAKDQLSFRQRLVSENSTMLRMAEQTGGKAFLGNNDLAGAVIQAIDTGSNYYTLAYSPSDPHWNGGYRGIAVKLQQRGLTLAYRRGYYADDPEAAAKNSRAAAAAQIVPEQANNPMKLAMMRGAPDPSQIIFEVRVLPVGDLEDKPAKGNTISAGSGSKGPYRNYAVDLAADPQAILFTKADDGVYHSYLQFVTYVYDQDGRLINSRDDMVRSNLPPPAYARIQTIGVPFHQEISVPAKGDYYIRIGVRDLRANRVGAVEVPVGIVRNLPLETPAEAGSASVDQRNNPLTQSKIAQ